MRSYEPCVLKCYKWFNLSCLSLERQEAMIPIFSILFASSGSKHCLQYVVVAHASW